MLGAIVNILFRCRHRKITRPITPVHKFGDTAGMTYVACLDCGKRLHYDLTTMRIGKAIPMPERPPLAEPFQDLTR